jgi:hypothetical protein
MSADPTFADFAVYGSEKWCAARVGRTYEWFRKARPALEAEGFPRRDRLIGLTHKGDVDTWLSRRRVLTDDAGARTTGHHGTLMIGENHDAL